ncbi:MAG: polymerase, sigma-24 subunit, subfamily, partial [Fibrobacteres bacterium]|nr:polymerase, sigma-24 subunit, subfamily [Fibrobacterota bacterium]
LPQEPAALPQEPAALPQEPAALPQEPAALPGAGPESIGSVDEEDFEWVLVFKAGREEGFNRLVLKHKDRIFGLCLRLLAGDRFEAEDAAQETFVKVYHALRDFRMESKFSSWLYRIAVNTCKNRVVSRSYQESRNHRDLEAAETDGAPSSPSPDQVLEAKGRGERIEEAIGRLPEEQRVLVVLRDVEGRSYEEIAETTGLNPGTVKSRLNRGRRQLQEWLRDALLAALLLAATWLAQSHRMMDGSNG